MKKITAVCLSLLFTSCVTMPRTVGQIKEGTYYAPSGKYSVPVPVNSGLGGRVQDSPWAVSFTDDFGHLFRIEGMPIPPDEVTRLNQMGRQNYLKPFLTEVYMPSTVLRVIPNATAGTTEELADIQGGAYYSEIDMPKGSISEVSHNGGPYEREDTVRGVLWFLRGHDIYVISTQLSQIKNFQADPKEEDARRRKMLREDTLKFARSIKFMEDLQPSPSPYAKPGAAE